MVDSPHQLLAVKPTVVDCKELKISRVRISFAKFVLEERETKSEEEEETSESDQDQDSESELFEVCHHSQYTPFSETVLKYDN